MQARMSLIKFVISVIATVAIGVACIRIPAAPMTPEGKTAATTSSIVVGIETSLTSLDPLDLRWNSDAYLAVWNLYDPLVRIDERGVVQPALAESWEMQTDQTRLVMNLRKGVFFHNGTPFSAQSVDSTFKRYQDIKEIIKGIEVLSDNTVAFNFEPLVSSTQIDRLFNLLAQIPILIESEGVPIGTGPYILADWAPNSRLILNPNQHYWQNEFVYLGSVAFEYYEEVTERDAALQAGKLDAIWGINAAAASKFQRELDGFLVITNTVSIFSSDPQTATQQLTDLLTNLDETTIQFNVCVVLRDSEINRLCSQPIDRSDNQQQILEEILDQYQIYKVEQLGQLLTEDLGAVSDLDSTIESLKQTSPPEVAKTPEWNSFVYRLENLSRSNYCQLSGIEQECQRWQQNPELLTQPEAHEVFRGLEKFSVQNLGQVSGIQNELEILQDNFAPELVQNSDFSSALASVETFFTQTNSAIFNIEQGMQQLEFITTLKQLKNFEEINSWIPLTEGQEMLYEFTTAQLRLGIRSEKGEWRGILEGMNDGPCAVCHPGEGSSGPDSAQPPSSGPIRTINPQPVVWATATPTPTRNN